MMGRPQVVSRGVRVTRRLGAWVIIQMKFDPAPETSVPGSPSGNPGGFMVDTGTLGVLHEHSERLDWGFAYELISGGDAGVNQSRPLAGDLVGHFDTNLIHVVGFHTRWQW